MIGPVGSPLLKKKFLTIKKGVLIIFNNLLLFWFPTKFYKFKDCCVTENRLQVDFQR